MRIRLSVDDGCKSDTRLSELCQKYEVDLIIYLPVEWRSLAYTKGYEPLSYDDAYVLAKTHEIGSHTITHRHLTDLSLHDAELEILESKMMLEQLFNTTITKFAPPRGYTKDLLTDITLTLYDSQRLTKGWGLVHIHPDSGANGNRPWRDCITDDTEELWCHSWELDKYNLWDELEQYLKERP